MTHVFDFVKKVETMKGMFVTSPTSREPETNLRDVWRVVANIRRMLITLRQKSKNGANV